MSLDVYLNLDGHKATTTEARIPIREDWQIKMLTRAEWDARFDFEPITTIADEESTEVYSANITHNLNAMAYEAGLYECLWRPDEHGLTKAAQLIEPLTCGLKLLQSDPARFSAFSPSNGWGTYEGLLSFVRNYLAACIRYQDADVRVSR